MVELFSQSRYFPQSRYSKKMRARKGATGGEPHLKTKDMLVGKLELNP